MITGKADRFVRGTPVLCTYGPDGEPRRAIPMHHSSGFARVAYDGTTILIQDLGGSLLYYSPDRDEPRQLWPGIDSFESHVWTPFIAPGGREIWLVSIDMGVVHRFRKPE